MHFLSDAQQTYHGISQDFYNGIFSSLKFTKAYLLPKGTSFLYQ